MNRKYMILCLLLAAACFSACARFHSRPVFADGTLADFEKRSLNSAELNEFFKLNGLHPDWPVMEWNLRSLALASLFFHPDLDVARAQWGVARAGRITAGERPNPGLYIATTYNRSLPAGEGSPWSPGFSLDITLETAGKRGIRIARSRQLDRAAYLNVQTVAWQVYSRLRQSLLALFGAERALALLQDKKGALDENTAIVEAQYGAGAVSAYQVAQVRMERQSSILELLEAEKTRDQAWVNLAAAVGVPLAAVRELPLRFADFERADAGIAGEEARRRALTTRSDILSALAEYAAAQSDLQLEVARQYPDIHLGPGYELDQSQGKWTLGITLSLPLFSRNRGPIAEAEARRTEAAARFLALQASIVSELDGALAGIRSSLPQAEAASALLDHLRQREKTAAAMLEIGEISKAELLALKLELSAAEMSRLQALVRVQEAVGALENAMQSSLAMPAAPLPAQARNER